MKKRHFKLDSGSVVPNLVSFVIPARNAERTIGKCIKSILSQKNANTKIEIIVVDDGSTDKTAEIAADLGAKVIRKPHSGVPESINVGIRNSRGSLIALVDSDIYICEDWLKEALNEMERYDAINTTRANPSLMRPHESFYYRILSASFSLGSKLSRGIEIPALGDASLIKRKVFEKVGGFDESFSPVGGQDVEFGIRVRKYGFRTKYSRNAKYFHEVIILPSLYTKIKKVIFYNHGLIKAFLKHRTYIGNSLISCWLLLFLYPLLGLCRRFFK
ncbi:MAG: glycosyltransferase [Candidatus Hadarchaeales archaeon]